MLALMFTTIFALICYANYKRFNDIIYPGFLQSFNWLMCLGFFTIHQSNFIDVSFKAYSVILVGGLLFSLGALMATRNHKPLLRLNRAASESLPSVKFLTALLPVCAIGFYFWFGRSIELSESGPTDNMLVNLRYALSTNFDESGGYGILAYFLTITFAATISGFIRMVSKTSTYRFKILFSLYLLLAIAYGVLSTGRGQLLSLFTAIGTVMLVLRAISPLRALTYFVGLAVSIFAIGGYLLGKGLSQAENLATNMSLLYTSLVNYSVSSLPAFSSYLDTMGDPTLGSHIFRTPLAILKALGFDVVVEPLVQPFTNVPMPTNIYTIYLPYLTDFGVIFGTMFQLGFGYLHGMLYRKATVENPKGLYVFYFSVTLHALLAQNGGDEYFGLMSTWVQYLLLGILLFYPRPMSPDQVDADSTLTKDVKVAAPVQS